MTSKETTAVASEHGSGQEITVWVGVPGLARGLPSSGSLLVVEAEPQRARELRQVLRDRPEALVCEEVLAAENEATVQWHRFNDTRLNGPSDLRIWQQRFPNLRQIDEEQRCGRRLGDLLDNWVPREGEQALAPLHLVLRQGDPLAALTGLGPWISQLQTVQLMLPWPEETMQLAETWLAEQNFGQDPQTSAMWNRDPVATRDWLLKEKEKEKQDLLVANQQLNGDCATARAERDIVVAKLEQLTTQWEEHKEAQNQTLAEIQQLQIEAEKLRSQLEDVKKELQQTTSDKLELQQKLQTEKNTSLNERQALKSLLPLELYREVSSELSDLDDDQLILHYLQHGRHETPLKNYVELHAELKASLMQNEEAEAKLNQLEAQFRLTHQQLETLKDVFARLADRQQSPTQEKEE
jgi:regulator of replication initiation timing